MPATFESVKNLLLREFPKEKNDGLNTARVEGFIRQEGLEVKPYIIFDRENLPKVKEIMDGTGLLRSTFNNGEGGYIFQKWI